MSVLLIHLRNVRQLKNVLSSQKGVFSMVVRARTASYSNPPKNLVLTVNAIKYGGSLESKQTRHVSYKNFGHKPVPTPNLTIVWYLFIGSAFFITLLVDLNQYLPGQNLTKRVDAKSLQPSEAEQTEEEGEVEGNGAVKKKRIGFRERKIIEYENRVRQYSTPDKVFRYFATYQLVHPNGDSEIFMSPDDFLRSITPGMKQPDGLGLDQFKRLDPKHVNKRLQEEIYLEEDSIFLKLGSSGLISFSDFIFLLTLLSASMRHIEIAFRMFDLNGDGDVDADEFDQVADLLRMSSSVGARHRDHNNTGSTLKGVNSALSAYFFGPERNQKLTIDKFLEFQRQLQREILTLEFRRKAQRDDGTLSEAEFADLMLCYAGFPAKKKRAMIKRVRKA